MKKTALELFFARFNGRMKAIDGWRQRAALATEASSLIDIYHEIYPQFEKLLWQSKSFEQDLELYQSLFREQEALISKTGEDHRHRFILSIPIADRPEHLQSCLESIYQLCHLYAYGGQCDGYFAKVRVIIAEDSKQPENIAQDKIIAQQFCDKGLRVDYVSLQEQYELLQGIAPQQRSLLAHLLTDQSADQFYRKGQAANRNLSYLKMMQLTESAENTLYYLVDSDQLFEVNRQSGDTDSIVSALNYFYYIDRIFRENKITMLTGKLVGDPPVSPSMMAVNFIDDVMHFLQRLSALDASQACRFHQHSKVPTGQAAYHDMASLFGFELTDAHFDYRCPLPGEHDHVACLEHFSTRLNAFFFGEHLTRKTWFDYQGRFDQLTPARTIYPGNYIVNAKGLKYIIPFGDLRFRMSGPTAGRLIKAEIGASFASANLPLLHQRTQAQQLANEFRPGVKQMVQGVDLSDEFERQFFGDLMLFSVADIAAQSSDGKTFEASLVSGILVRKEAELLQAYQHKHDAVVEKNDAMKVLLQQPHHWWNQLPQMHTAVKNIQQFCDNIDHNFGAQSSAWQQIQSSEHRKQRRQQIFQALMNYKSERDAWDQLVACSLSS